jgi:hypothetical protein
MVVETSIGIRLKTKKKIIELKKNPKESYDDVLSRELEVEP